MAAGLEQDMQTMETLTIRAQKAAELIDRLRSELQESRRREEDLRASLRQTADELDKARTDIKFLRMSHRLAASPDSIIESRRLISNLIRNIDKAIADLKE